MRKATLKDVTPEQIRHYCTILERTVSDLNFLVAELENEVTDNMSDAVSQEIRFDAIPIVRRLRNIKDYAKESLRVYQSKLD